MLPRGQRMLLVGLVVGMLLGSMLTYSTLPEGPAPPTTAAAATGSAPGRAPAGGRAVPSVARVVPRRVVHTPRIVPGSAIVPALPTREELAVIANELKLKRGVELGVQRGWFARAMLQQWKTAEEYHLVDIWKKQENYKDLANFEQPEQDKIYNEAQSNLAPWKDKITICRDFTINCAEKYPDEHFDFIYVDARHDRKGVLQDLEKWWPKLRRGGIIAGHDYLEQDEILKENQEKGDDWTLNYDGSVDETRRVVKGAVDDFFMDSEAETRGHLLQVLVTYTDGMPYSSWAVRRPAKADTPTLSPLRTFRHREDLGDIAYELQLKRGVEIGVRDGSLSRAFLSRWKNADEYHLVDVWPDASGMPTNAREQAMTNTEAWKDKITVCRDATTNCAEKYTDEYFDFIYFDARHDRKGVAQDLELWWPKLRRGGIMAGHDYLVQGGRAVLNYDGTRVDSRVYAKVAVDEFFMSAAAEAVGRMRQVISSYRDGDDARSWAVRK